jgi:hypothetical protein
VRVHPPRYRVGRAAVACYLYKDQPLAGEDEPRSATDGPVISLTPRDYAARG